LLNVYLSDEWNVVLRITLAVCSSASSHKVQDKKMDDKKMVLAMFIFLSSIFLSQ